MDNNDNNNNASAQKQKQKTYKLKNNEQKYIYWILFQRKNAEQNFCVFAHTPESEFSRAFEYARQCDNNFFFRNPHLYPR